MADIKVTITVPLVDASIDALTRIQARGNLSGADAVNRAIQLLDTVEAEQAAGTEVVFRRSDGSSYTVHLI